MSDTLVEQKTATVAVKHKTTYADTYGGYTEVSAYLPVDITDLADAEAVADALQHSVNQLKVVVFDALGVEHRYEDGVIVPTIVVATNATSEPGRPKGNPSQRYSDVHPPAARTTVGVPEPARPPLATPFPTSNVVTAAFNGSQTFNFRSAADRSPIEWTPTAEEADELVAKGACGDVWIYVHADRALASSTDVSGNTVYGGAKQKVGNGPNPPPLYKTAKTKEGQPKKPGDDVAVWPKGR
jgi:hypothetical protein